ncbi:MAG: hypothetical protein ACI3V5_09770 [Faecousia sp.]
MKIQISSSGRDFSLTLPTKLVFSKFVIRMVVRNSRAADGLENLSPETVERLAAELGRVKEKYGSWELVDVLSSDGECVKIIL